MLAADPNSETGADPVRRRSQDDELNLHPSKRQRILACKRCRRRKQKCDSNGEDPCSNCRRTNEECEPTEPVTMRSSYKADYVQALEQRILYLERASLGQANSVSSEQSKSQPVEGSVRNDRDPDPVPTLPEPVEIGSRSNALQTVQLHPSPPNFEPLPELNNGSGDKQILETSPSAGHYYDSNPSPAQTHSSHGTHIFPQRGSRSPGTFSSRWSSLIHQPSYISALPNGIIEKLVSNGNSSDSVRGKVAPCSCTISDHHESASPEQYFSQFIAQPEAFPSTVLEHLVNIYFEMANTQWPFLHRGTFDSWLLSWKGRSGEGSLGDRDPWQGFFVNMVLSVGLLLDPKITRNINYTSMNFYCHAVRRYLPAVLSHSSALLRVQAHLIMAVHALFSSSSEKIILTVASAVRYCVLAQFHVAESEPKSIDAASRIEIQMRRRAFWVAYSMDRLAYGVFRLPFAIADDTITIPIFDNIDDSSLTQMSNLTEITLGYSSVSTALHRLRCFQIQSEILNVTMRSDFTQNFDSLSNWRSYMLSKLDNWKSQLQHVTEANGKSYTNDRWILIVYNHALLYLHRPTKSNVRGPAGDWSVQASTQIALVFRKFQADQSIAHPWLGLISQFSGGITMLYCFWATPPRFRTASYNSTKVQAGLRACSNILAIMADRWDNAKVLRDVFELFATEIPLVENLPTNQCFGNERTLKCISAEAVDEIRSKLPLVRSMVINHEILRMIEEMISEDLPKDEDAPEPFSALGDKNDIFSPSVPISSQTFRTNHLTSYQFLSPWMTGDNTGGPIGDMSPEPSLEFPGTLTGYDVF